MKVKNIVRISAELLGLKEIIKYLDGEVVESEELFGDVNNLVLATNMVNNTIASSYIDLIDSVTVNCRDGLIAFGKISNKSIIDIKSIESGSGRKLSYKVMPDGLKINHAGECCIVYTYFPDKVSLDDDINYYLKLNEITFAMGVASEYLYIKGVIDDAYMWDKRFKTSLFNLLRPRRSISMPARRW